MGSYRWSDSAKPSTSIRRGKWVTSIIPRFKAPSVYVLRRHSINASSRAMPAQEPRRSPITLWLKTLVGCAPARHPYFSCLVSNNARASILSPTTNSSRLLQSHHGTQEHQPTAHMECLSAITLSGTELERRGVRRKKSAKLAQPLKSTFTLNRFAESNFVFLLAAARVLPYLLLLRFALLCCCRT